MTRRAPTGRRRARIPWPLAALLAVIVGMAPALASGPAAAQARDEAAPAPLVEPTRTDDPRETFRSFLRLSGEMEEEIGRAPSELQSLRRISYAVFCLKKKKEHKPTQKTNETEAKKERRMRQQKKQ